MRPSLADLVIARDTAQRAYQIETDPTLRLEYANHLLVQRARVKMEVDRQAFESRCALDITLARSRKTSP